MPTWFMTWEWEFDSAGSSVTTSKANPLSEVIAGWNFPPRAFGGGFDGRVIVIGGGDEGPQFARVVHLTRNPRQMTVAIDPSGTEPLLAGRLHVTLLEPGGVLKNHDLRIIVVVPKGTLGGLQVRE